jgi:hypothetical protein
MLEPLAGDAKTASTIAASIVWLIPGIFGFLVWELRSNWQLYLANRSESLRPAIVGDHGESMLRLLKPGFHSGTVPKLFGKIRRAVRKLSSRESRVESREPEIPNGARPLALDSGLSALDTFKIPPKFTEAMHHVEHAVRHFVEREFIAILETTGALDGAALHVGAIQLASNNLRVEISRESRVQSPEPEIPDGSPPLALDSGLSTLDSQQPLVIVFQEQSGRLIAGILQAGWLADLDEQRRTVVGEALAGLYAQSGVDMVREQIVANIPIDDLRYDIEDRSLVLWPDPNYEVEVRYELEERTRLVPRPKATAREHGLPVLQAEEMIFGQMPIAWPKWTDYWTAVAEGKLDAPPAKLARFVLPATERRQDAAAAKSNGNEAAATTPAAPDSRLSAETSPTEING